MDKSGIPEPVIFLSDCLNYKPLLDNQEKVLFYKNNMIKRIFCITIAILSLYKPFNILKNVYKNIISISKSSYKFFCTRSSEIKKFGLIVDSLTKVFFLISALLCFSTGLKICAGLYLLISTTKIIHAVEDRNYKKALHKFLDLISIVGLIATMIFGSMQLFIAITIFSIGYGVYQASYEFKNGLIPEAITRVALSCFGIKSITDKIKT
jgi:hypothetical protein